MLDWSGSPTGVRSMPAETATTLYDLPAISREEIRRRLRTGGLTIVDVLSAESYANGHIPGAINLPLDEMMDRAHEVLPDPNVEIAVYCGKFT